MSKDRARRRAERLAAGALARAEATRRDRERLAATRRRQARRAALRRLVPRLPRSAGYSRRTREQRVGTVMVIVAVGALALLLFDSWTVRIAVLIVTLLATPVISTALLGRPHR